MFEKIKFLFRKKKKRNAYEKVTHIHTFQQDQMQLFHKRRKKILFIKNLSTFITAVKTYKLSIFLWLLFGVIWLWTVLIIWPFFEIKTILITKQDTLTNIEQAYASVEYVRGKNILFLDFWEIANRIQKGQNSIQNIELEREFPQSLYIRLKSYSPLFQTESHILLSNWVLLEKWNSSDQTLPFIYIISQNKDTLLFWNILNPKNIENIHLLLQELQKNIAGFSPITLQYFVEEKELILSDSQGTLYIFDVQADIGRQVEQLSIFQKEKSELFKKKYIYIDVRIPQKLFLCGYEEEYSCKRNIIEIYGSDVFTNWEKVVSQ